MGIDLVSNVRKGLFQNIELVGNRVVSCGKHGVALNRNATNVVVKELKINGVGRTTTSASDTRKYYGVYVPPETKEFRISGLSVENMRRVVGRPLHPKAAIFLGENCDKFLIDSVICPGILPIEIIDDQLNSNERSATIDASALQVSKKEFTLSKNVNVISNSGIFSTTVYLISGFENIVSVGLWAGEQWLQVHPSSLPLRLKPGEKIQIEVDDTNQVKVLMQS